MDECAWPTCDRTTGLIPFMRESDGETIDHCGQHYRVVEMLAAGQKVKIGRPDASS